jgi:hypothetical protein
VIEGQDHPGLAQHRRHPRRRDRRPLRHRSFHPLPYDTQDCRLTHGNSLSLTLESELTLFGALCKNPNLVKKPPQVASPSALSPPARLPGLLAEVRTLIGEARRQATAAVNVSLTALYWRIGRRLGQEVLAKERAGYGEQVMVGREGADERVRPRIHQEESLAHGSVRRSLSRRKDCRHTVATIELVSLP